MGIHPNIIKLIDLFENESRYFIGKDLLELIYLVMEYCEG